MMNGRNSRPREWHEHEAMIIGSKNSRVGGMRIERWEEDDSPVPVQKVVASFVVRNVRMLPKSSSLMFFFVLFFFGFCIFDVFDYGW